MDKRINHSRIKVLLKNGYNEIDINNQTIICPDGTQKKIPQWDIDYYLCVYKHQQKRGVCNERRR